MKERPYKSLDSEGVVEGTNWTSVGLLIFFVVLAAIGKFIGNYWLTVTACTFFMTFGLAAAADLAWRKFRE